MRGVELGDSAYMCDSSENMQLGNSRDSGFGFSLFSGLWKLTFWERPKGKYFIEITIFQT